jgi:multicomponent K+:H+ antiporter subunit F
MDTVLQIASTLLTVAILLGLWRLARGPTVIDRILAFDLITTCVVGMIVLICIAVVSIVGSEVYKIVKG